MRLALLTRTARRHLAFAQTLARIADELVLVQEIVGSSPRSKTMREYFQHVETAEQAVFPTPSPRCDLLLQTHIPLSECDPDFLAPIFASDQIIVFGTSYLTGRVLDELEGHGAWNLHAGIAPEYRGSACNFWAEYDGHPELVGATLHRLTSKLDGGPIMQVNRAPLHPAPFNDPFVRGMLAIREGQQATAQLLLSGRSSHPATPQDPSRLIRYSRHADFTDAIAREYLNRLTR